MRAVRVITVILVVVIVSVASIVISSYAGLPKSPFSGQPTPTAVSTHVVQFTIVESDPPDPLAGINGSYYKSLTTVWPVIRVHQGDTVIITVMNNNSREIHGFAIVHYDDRGFSQAPGQQHTITFVANEVGDFRIYCNVFCAIHPYMQNGELIVSA